MIEQMYCVTPGCTLEAMILRPSSNTWLTDTGVLSDVSEWLCVVHGLEVTS